MVSILNKNKLIIDHITEKLILFRIDIPHKRNQYNRYKEKMKGNQITNKVRINQRKYDKMLKYMSFNNSK